MSVEDETTPAVYAAEEPSVVAGGGGSSSYSSLLQDRDHQGGHYNDLEHLDDLDLPPLRMHATRGKDTPRLSASSLQIPPGIQQQMSASRSSLEDTAGNKSNSNNNTGVPPSQCSSTTSSTVSLFHSTTSGGRRSRSRSHSPSMREMRSRQQQQQQQFQQGGQGGIETNSSFSSLEEFVDPDILYDKMGFVELDLEKQRQQQQQVHNKNKNLTPVSERMSEDTLEDVHAFSDLSVTRPSSSVGGSSTVGGGSTCTVNGEVSSHVLEPLDEGDEDDIESDGDDVEPLGTMVEQVILTNMERISLQDKNSKHKHSSASNKEGADSPSLPTA